MKPGCTARRAAAGVSLVELLVAMAIALVLTMAVANVMTHSEGAKRSTTSVNDVNQTGAYVAYVLDRAIRSAGSGYAHRWRDVFGCAINASRNDKQILPAPAAFSAPFDTVPTQLRVAPVLISKGADDTGSDVVIVMTGSGGFGETGQPVNPGSVSSDAVRLPNTLGWRGDDLLLIAERDLGCMVQQVPSSFKGSVSQQLTFGGQFYRANGTNVSLTAFGTGSSTTYALALGNAGDNPPLFQMFGVGDNDTLLSYDLLGIAAADAVPLAEGVAQIRALYGIDTNGDSKLDEWVDPSGDYAIGSLLDGTAAARQRLRNIVAVRLGLILRSSLIETDRLTDPNARKFVDDEDRSFVERKTIELFGDLEGLSETRTLTDDERKRRHRSVELTIPLRNMLL